MGRLRKGGEVDYDEVARAVIRDFLRGNLPWFTPPPEEEVDGDGEQRQRVKGREALKVRGHRAEDENDEEELGEDEEYQGIQDE